MHNHIEWMGLNWSLNFDIAIYWFQHHPQIPCNYNNFIKEVSNSHPNNNYMKILMDHYLIGIIFEHNNLNFKCYFSNNQNSIFICHYIIVNQYITKQLY